MSTGTRAATHRRRPGPLELRAAFASTMLAGRAGHLLRCGILTADSPEPLLKCAVVTLHARTWFSQIGPYRPGRRAVSDDGSLASNESPLGVSDGVVSAVASAIRRGNRYPDPLADGLRADLATLHGVDPDQVLVGNGSDELIYLLAAAYLAQSGHSICADPAYRIDEISTQVVGARLTKVPLRNWAHDLDAMSAIAADIAYVVNPHNPTGTAWDRERIERFAADAAADLVVVDEAYIDFTDDPEATTALPLVRTGRVAVLRTFSKVYGLAGLQIGYLIAAADIVDTLRKIRAPFSVNALSQAAAAAALRDAGYRHGVREHTLRTRPRVTRIFAEAGHEVVPSQANFVLVLAPDEDRLMDSLAACGVSMRSGTSLGLPGTIRVSMPSDAGLRLLERWLARAGS